MIKSVVVPRIVNQETFERLQPVLRELGFRDGDGWEDQRSSGAPLVASSGCIELVVGQPTADADLICEVSDVDAAFELLRHRGFASATPERTHWGSRMFVADVPGVFRIAFFSYEKAA
jgi:hypothetical protein